jgi:hypothetical protein
VLDQPFHPWLTHKSERKTQQQLKQQLHRFDAQPTGIPSTIL